MIKQNCMEKLVGFYIIVIIIIKIHNLSKCVLYRFTEREENKNIILLNVAKDIVILLYCQLKDVLDKANIYKLMHTFLYHLKQRVIYQGLNIRG